MFDMATAMGSSSQMSFIKSDQASTPTSPSLCSPNKFMSNTDSRSSFDSMSPSTPGSIDTLNIKQEPGSELFDSKCKRKISFSQLGLPPRGHPPATVARRNARERNRVKQVNNGFAALKQHIPLGHRSKKMSKVETLRCAVEYIKNLQGLLDAEGNLIQTASSQNIISSSLHRSIAEASFENRLQHFSSNNGQHQQTPKLEGGNNGYNNNNHHHHHHHNNNQHPNIPNQLSPASSEDPPSPSYPSQESYVVSASLYDCENYEPVSPEDEELLDAISWWQQS